MNEAAGTQYQLSSQYQLSELTEMVLVLPERAMTSKEVQRACWKIWKHCRLNDTSLDSERHCEQIEQVVIGAIAGIQRRMENAMVSEAKMKAELQAARQLNTALKGNVRQLTDIKDKAMAALHDIKNMAHESNSHVDRLTAALNMLLEETIERIPDEEERTQSAGTLPSADGTARK